MRGGVRSPFEFLSMSTLDLFASMLGTFVLITFVLLPYYLRQPSLEADIAQAQAEASGSAGELQLYREKLAAAQGARMTAETTLVAAQRQLARAQTVSQPVAAAPEPPETVPAKKPGSLSIPDLDLVIVIDTTGSMRHELRELQSGLLGVIRVLHRLSPSLAVGVVAYRDRGEDYVTRSFPLTRIEDGTLRGILEFVADLKAEKGGDPPEAVDVALAEAAGLAWRNRVLGRILVIGDAPAHAPDWERSFALAAQFHTAAGPGRTVAAIYTGGESEGLSFFERLAEAGGGDFRAHKGEMIESILLSVLKEAQK